jgi:hypothetical protein
MGGPPRLTDAQKAEARQRRVQGATLAELARSYDVSRARFRALYYERANTLSAASASFSQRADQSDPQSTAQSGIAWSSPRNANSMPHFVYLTWRRRFIPAKPRTVKFWPPGIIHPGYMSIRPLLSPFIRKVEAGDDLTPHLSDLVNTAGFVLPTPANTRRGDDKDMVLTRLGLHHFHVGAVAPDNPKGRSGHLIFAEVTESDFTVIAVGDHRVFTAGSPESIRFYETSLAYITRTVLPGQGFMLSPVETSGDSMELRLFSRACESQIECLDQKLDDRQFIDELWNGQPIEREGQSIQKPAKPSFKWHFDDLRFGIIERKTLVFFCIYRFFTR